MSQSPQHMTPDQIVAEIGELRESMNATAQRMLDLSKALYTQMRRTTASNATPVYIAYSNAWMRFAGTMTQGMRRAMSSDRVLERYRQAEEEKVEQARRAAQASLKREAVRTSEASRKAAFGDLIELYGEEMVRDASR